MGETTRSPIFIADLLPIVSNTPTHPEHQAAEGGSSAVRVREMLKPTPHIWQNICPYASERLVGHGLVLGATNLSVD